MMDLKGMQLCRAESVNQLGVLKARVLREFRGFRVSNSSYQTCLTKHVNQSVVKIQFPHVSN